MCNVACSFAIGWRSINGPEMRYWYLDTIVREQVHSLVWSP